MIIKRKRKDGSTAYQVRVDVRDRSTGTVNRKTVGTYRLREAARRAERKALDAIEAGSFTLLPPPAPRVWTVANVVEMWLVSRKVHVTANTFAGYESAWRLHVREAVGAREIATLTRPDVKELVRRWQDSGTGAQLQNRALLVLRCALEEAVEDGIVAANPATGIKLPSPKSRRDLPVWTPSHLRAFLDAGERDCLGVFWYLTSLEGFRRAEALGLRWSDLHWNADETSCTATIVQTLISDQAYGGAPLIQSRAKTKGSQRTVMLTTPTVAALLRHRDRQAFRHRELADVEIDIDLVVVNELGNMVRPDAVDRHRAAVMADAGVPAIRTHDLRHLAATTMLRAGTPLAIVAQKLGHTDTSTTFGTYGHLVPEDQAAANAAVETFLSRSAVVRDGSGG